MESDVVLATIMSTVRILVDTLRRIESLVYMAHEALSLMILFVAKNAEVFKTVVGD